MPHQLCLFRAIRPRLIWYYLLTGCLLLSTSIPAMAEYTPPEGEEPPSEAIGMGGSRGGCAGDAQTSFTALAPVSHAGQTAATYPTVALYVPDRQPFLIEFRIYQYEAAGRLNPEPVYKVELSSTPGIMTVMLPQTQPPLVVWKRYFWQAALICDPNHGSEDLIVGADIQIVNSSIPESERWYDLFQTALSQEPSSSTALLEELATLEQRFSEVWILQHSQQLNQIVEAER